MNEAQTGPELTIRQHRLALAAARRAGVTKQRISYFRNQGYPPEQIARLTGVALDALDASTAGSS